MKFDQLLTVALKSQSKNAPKIDAIYSFISGKYVKVKREDYLNVVKGSLIQY